MATQMTARGSTARRVTKHEELTSTLLALARDMTPGEQFPSQSELMRRYGVSDRTVLRSLDDLQRAGWIFRQHGKGTFVTDPSTNRANATAPPLPAASAARSTVIAALILTIGPVYQHLLDQLTRQAESVGLTLVCHHAHSETSFEDVLPLEALNPRGFILFSYYLLPIARRLRESGHRVVIVGAPPAGVVPELPCVYNDQDDGGWQATRHLIDMGHRRIAYIEPETRYSLLDTLRWQGHLRAIAEARREGIEIEASLIETKEWTRWRDDPSLCTAFFNRPEAPTGLASWNDDKGVELLHLFYRAGIRVPEDVSLVGYDDLPIGRNSIPPLTTVDSGIAAQLRAVMRLLSDPVVVPDRAALAHSVMVSPNLVVRSSTSVPKEPATADF